MRFFKRANRKVDKLEAYIAGLIILQNNLATQVQNLREEVDNLRKYQREIKLNDQLLLRKRK